MLTVSTSKAPSAEIGYLAALHLSPVSDDGGDETNSRVGNVDDRDKLATSQVDIKMEVDRHLDSQLQDAVASQDNLTTGSNWDDAIEIRRGWR